MAVKAPFNYIGNKYRIINSIQECFPEEIDTFVDLFCGGCDVSINTQANSIYANDINYHVIFNSMMLIISWNISTPQ